MSLENVTERPAAVCAAAGADTRTPAASTSSAICPLWNRQRSFIPHLRSRTPFWSRTALFHTPERSDATSEVHLEAELQEPRRHDLGRRQPPRAERLVVAGNRVPVQRIVEIEPDVRTRPAVGQNLRNPKIQLIRALAV